MTASQFKWLVLVRNEAKRILQITQATTVVRYSPSVQIPTGFPFLWTVGDAVSLHSGLSTNLL